MIMKKIVFMILLSISFLLTSCSAGKVAVSGTALMLHPSRILAQYNSPYTLCEKNVLRSERLYYGNQRYVCR